MRNGKNEKRGGASGAGNAGGGEDLSNSSSESDQPSIFDNAPSSTPKFVPTSGAPTEQDREEWMTAREEPIPEGTPQILVNRFLDNKAMSRNVLVAASRDPVSFRGVRDSAGNLQAGATVTNERDHIYIDTFTTAPWNVLENSPKSVRGAGLALMAQIARESIDRGHGGQIRLNSLSSAVSFYEGIGLVEDEETGEMILSSENSRRFLQRRRARGE